jgi:hypothetical protein
MKGGNYVQLATVDEEGNPTVRTVVFRGFTYQEASEGGKMKHLALNPRCEVVRWFPLSSEQFRISASALCWQ